MKFNRQSKNGTIARILAAIRKQKLFNKGNSVLFIDSTSIKMSPERSLTTKLHLCCTSSCPVVFRLSPGNFREAPEGKKLIESIYSKNNNYLLMDRAYEDDKTLAKNHGFKAVIPPKKKS